MPRPTTPLISPPDTLQLALRIVDDEGLDALSIRRLAGELGVTGAALYHHFPDKEAILGGVARLALAEFAMPSPEAVGWREWLVAGTELYRDTLSAHPNLLPVLLERYPRGIGLSANDEAVVVLEAAGIPLGRIAPLLDALEQLVLGSASFRCSRPVRLGDRVTNVGRARAATVLDENAAFALACRTLINGMTEGELS